jgi:chromatin remodeling complex protein RSC6
MVVRKKTKTRAKTSARKKTARKSVKKKAVRKKTTARKTKKVKKVKSKKPRKASGLTKMTYALSEELQAIVGSKNLSRPEVVKKLWAYIKSHRCQDSSNRRMINPDAKLAKVIGNRPIDMLKLAGCLSKHLK